jgi:hypothetical protein
VDGTDRDIERLLRSRHHNGGDYWASADGRWGVGSPWSSFACGLMLVELGLDTADPLLRGIADLLWACQAEDGRIRPGPHLGTQPCHTAHAARLLCRLGHGGDGRLDRTFEHLLATQSPDGGWRCNVQKYGAGPDTDASNPGVTLSVLDAFRYRDDLPASVSADRAVDTLLDHWLVRRPLGPCRFGIGSRFMRLEYPFTRYNLFMYVYVLSFFPRATGSPAFAAAHAALRANLVDGMMVVGHQNPRLKEIEFCREGRPSTQATRRYGEVLANLERHHRPA